MANKYLVIGAIIGIIVLILAMYLHDSFSTNKNYAPYQSAYINKTLSITSIRTAEQYESLQKGFPEPEISACNYDLNKEYDTAGKCTLNSVAEQPDGNYIFVCSCVISSHT